MKWKKDPFFDSIDILTKSKDLHPLITIKNIISNEPSNSIPISLISKRAREFEISGRVAGFLRKYPSFFEEFTGPQYNLPWFRLTQDAIKLNELEQSVYNERKLEIVQRLRRLILMSREKMLPFRIVQGMLWYLGLPEDFLKNPEEIPDGYFEIIEIGDGEKRLRAIVDPNEQILSAIQRSSTDKFPLFPSKGLRLKRKIEAWLEGFQSLPYVSPYEDSSSLDPSSDISEKRVVGVLHELLSLFVDGLVERRKILCLRTHFPLPQKFYKCFERHPHVFYILLKNKTCYVVLKEAYCGGLSTGIERHPMFGVRKKYVKLMNKSDAILRSRRSGKHLKRVGEERLDESLGSEKGEVFNGCDQVVGQGMR